MSANTGASERARVLLANTPGVVSDRILSDHGVTRDAVCRLRRTSRLPIERVKGLGYRLVRS